MAGTGEAAVQKKLALSYLGLIAVLTPPSFAMAQESDAPRLEEIIVTARRTSEALQTTPVAVNAISQQQLAAAQINSVAELTRKAPALSVGSGGPGGPGTAYLAIRGQTTTGGGSTADPAVATYIDGVYFARSTAGNLGLFDMAQAEVLRGPQGTLFGRNTTGGALNLTTVQPNGEFGGYGRLEYGNYNAVQGDAAVTLPIKGDELSLRLAGRYASRDGYFYNPISNSKYNDLDHFWGVRGTVRWAPAAGPVDVTISGDISDFRDNGQAFSLVALSPTSPLLTTLTPYFVGPGGGGQHNQTYTAFPLTSTYARFRAPTNVGHNGGVSGVINADLGQVSVKSISAWREMSAKIPIDIDATPITLSVADTLLDEQQYSEEVQVNFKIGRLTGIAGAMYFHESGTEQSVSNATSPSGLQQDLGLYNATSKSAYMQGNYEVTDKLRFTAGYRYTWDSRRLNRRGVLDIANPNSCSPPIPLTPTGCSLPLAVKFDYPAWLISLDYKLDENIFLYAKVSQASLSGGFNVREAPTGREAFGPEKRREAEVGAKVSALDRRLRAGVTLFTGRTYGAQRQAFGLRSNGTVSQFTQNTGNLDTKGAELELSVLPWRGMTVDAAAALLDANYQAGTFLQVGAGGVITDRSGEVPVQSPKRALNVGATQKFELPLGVVTAHIDYAHYSDKAISQGTAPPNASPAAVVAQAGANAAGTIKGYGVVNGRLGLELPNRVEVYAWAKNLTNTHYYTFAFAAFYPSLGIASQNPAAPRTFGIGVQYSF